MSPRGWLRYLQVFALQAVDLFLLPVMQVATCPFVCRTFHVSGLFESSPSAVNIKDK